MFRFTLFTGAEVREAWTDVFLQVLIPEEQSAPNRTRNSGEGGGGTRPYSFQIFQNALRGKQGL